MFHREVLVSSPQNALEEFFRAVQSGDAPTVRKTIAADSELLVAKNSHNQTPVLAAAYHGQNQVAELLVAQGTPLDLAEAAALGKLDPVTQFVAADASLARSYSPDGFPVCALAAAFGQLQVVEYLLQHGADVNAAASNGTGYTALTGAVTGGHEKIVSLLLENGANVNYRYGPGYSPLLAAAANGHLAIVKRLLEHGADPQVQANDGTTPLSVAESRGHHEVASHLKNIQRA